MFTKCLQNFIFPVSKFKSHSRVNDLTFIHGWKLVYFSFISHILGFDIWIFPPLETSKFVPHISALCSFIRSDTLPNLCYSLRASIPRFYDYATYIDILLPLTYEIFFHRNCLSDDFTCSQCFLWLTKISHPPWANFIFQSWQGLFPAFCLQRVINVKAFDSTLT
jgi:hypothetical protein